VKKAIDKHAKYTTTELDRSRPVKKGAATRRRLVEQVALNMHTIGTSFVGKVRDVRQIAEAQIGEGVADMVEFEAQVNGHEATEKANRIQAWQGLLDWRPFPLLSEGRTRLGFCGLFHALPARPPLFVGSACCTPHYSPVDP